MWTLDVQDVFLGGQDTATVQLQEFDTGWPDLLSYTGEGPRGQHGSSDPWPQLGGGPPTGTVLRATNWHCTEGLELCFELELYFELCFEFELEFEPELEFQLELEFEFDSGSVLPDFGHVSLAASTVARPLSSMRAPSLGHWNGLDWP